MFNTSIPEWQLCDMLSLSLCPPPLSLSFDSDSRVTHDALSLSPSLSLSRSLATYPKDRIRQQITCWLN